MGGLSRKKVVYYGKFPQNDGKHPFFLNRPFPAFAKYRE
jgi:hypothetical protein